MDEVEYMETVCEIQMDSCGQSAWRRSQRDLDTELARDQMKRWREDERDRSGEVAV